jgi:MFS superfamily sulfate permease-like transporter
VTVTAPVFSSLRGYRRSWGQSDAIAALTLLAIAVPSQLATSRLAGMPPITGLYAFVAGSVLFAALGCNSRLSVGADSTIAPLFAVGVAHFATAGSGRYIDLVGLVAVGAGILVAAVWLLRLGWLAEFLSAPIITGFLAGVGIIIVVHQLPALLGVASSGGSTAHRIAEIVRHLGATNGWTLGIGAAVLAIEVLGASIDPRLPGALAGLVASTALVAAGGLRGRGVQVLGVVHASVPRLGLHGLSWTAVGDAAPIAAVVALVIVIQTAATTRAFAVRGGDDERSVGRDFLGVGAGNVIAGLGGAFPVNASPSGTAVLTSSGARSQAAPLGAAIAVVLLVPAAGLLDDVPLATLAGVLLFVAGRLFHGRELVAIARFDRPEFALAAVTLLVVALAGVEPGIAVAVGLAILDRAGRTARPQLHVLGRIPGTTSWIPVGAEDATPLPGVLVVLFATPLWYANSVHFNEQLSAALAAQTAPVRLVVLDTVGMTDLDFTGSQALREVLSELSQRQIAFAIARAGERVQTSLARSGLLARIGPERLYSSVEGAVTAGLPDRR